MTISAVDVAHDDDLTFRLQENNTPFFAAFIKANPSGLGIYGLFTAFVGACQFMGLDPYDVRGAKPRALGATPAERGSG